jgi:1,4-alpha-glucan branching enzyme
VRDLNRLYREQPALHRLDCEARGFEWIDAQDAGHSTFSWLRRDDAGGIVIVASNMTPVPRQGFRLGVPEGPRRWREALNTDSAFYGGSNLGNGAGAEVHDQPAHGRAQSIVVTLPPLATVFLVPG